MTDTNMIGHNNPPVGEESGWHKAYFYMPMKEAEMVISMLEAFKREVPKSQTDVRYIVQGRIDFLRRKMQ
jgi:hypothetical protein